MVLWTSLQEQTGELQNKAHDDDDEDLTAHVLTSTAFFKVFIIKLFMLSSNIFERGIKKHGIKERSVSVDRVTKIRDQISSPHTIYDIL